MTIAPAGLIAAALAAYHGPGDFKLSLVLLAVGGVLTVLAVISAGIRKAAGSSGRKQRNAPRRRQPRRDQRDDPPRRRNTRGIEPPPRRR